MATIKIKFTFTHIYHILVVTITPPFGEETVFLVITTTILVIQQSIIPPVYNNNVHVHNDNCSKAVSTIITLSRTKLHINCVYIHTDYKAMNYRLNQLFYRELLTNKHYTAENIQR